MKMSIKTKLKLLLPVLSTKVAYKFVESRAKYFQLYSSSSDGAKPKSMCVCVRAKNEGRFLPEFVAHHLALGFAHVYVYDNASEDETASILAPLVAAGIVTLVPWPNRPAAPSCYEHYMEKYARQHEWTAFIDADEFICEKEKGALKKLLTSIEAPGLALNWRYMGGSGYTQVPSGLVTEAFQRSNCQYDFHIKVIARPSEIVGYFNSHNFFYRKQGRAVNVGVVPTYGSRCKPPRNVDSLHIRHYVYRSDADYMRKVKQGYVDASGGAELARRKEFQLREASKHNSSSFPMSAAAISETKEILEGFGYGEPYVSLLTAER